MLCVCVFFFLGRVRNHEERGEREKAMERG
jgi:hypothetical protein